MVQTRSSVFYKAFGLKIISDVEFPEIPKLNELLNTVDIEIIVDVDRPLPDNETPFDFKVKHNQVQFLVPNTANFIIEEGKRIFVTPMEDADFDLIRLFILGTCMGILLMQRSILPLHGSCVVINGKAYAFVGESGAGKSTLASALLDHGFPLLSDDVIAVTLKGDQKVPFATPSYPQQKLWQDSLNLLGRVADDYQSIFGRETKYCVPVISNYISQAVPLAGVIELIKTENQQINICPIKGVDRLRLLSNHTYRNFLIPSLGLMEWHFKTMTSLSSQIDVYQLCRPSMGSTTDQLVSLVIDICSRGGIKHA